MWQITFCIYTNQLKPAAENMRWNITCVHLASSDTAVSRQQEMPLKRFLTTRGFWVGSVISNNVYTIPLTFVFIFISCRNFSFKCRFWKRWNGSIGVKSRVGSLQSVDNKNCYRCVFLIFPAHFPPLFCCSCKPLLIKEERVTRLKTSLNIFPAVCESIVQLVTFASCSQ